MIVLEFETHMAAKSRKHLLNNNQTNAYKKKRGEPISSAVRCTQIQDQEAISTAQEILAK